MATEAEWEGLQWTKSSYNIFTHFYDYFKFNLDETSFLLNKGRIKVIGT